MHGGNVYQAPSVSFSPSPKAAVGAVVGTTTTTSAIATAAALTTTTSSSTRTAPAAATRTTFSTVAAISATSTSKTAQPHDPLHSQRRLIKTMVSGWVASMDKRPGDRTGEDLDLIYCRLKEIQAFDKFHPMLLHQICIVGYYEDLEKGVTLFRQGDIGTNWYTVVSGTLQVYLSDTGDQKDLVTLCTLGTGTTFGESVLTNKPRHATVVTSDFCELIRVEQKDFKILWERNKQLMEGVITPLSSLRADKSDILKSHQRYTRDASVLSQKFNGLPPPNCVAPITDDPSEAMFHAKDILRTVIMIQAPHMIRDRKYHLRTYRQCMVGAEMVDWLMQYSTLVLTRIQAVGMWQALLEEGVISHVCEEHPFRDKYLFYRFVDGRTDTVGTGITSTGGTSGHGLPPPPPTMELKHYEEELADVLKMLSQVGPDAIMRMILRKPSCERSPEDLEIIYEELLHIKALSHLSTMVKRELAGVLMFESHTKKGTVLFRQGDEGKSWYIILKGSVNVSIYGKGIVCKLMEGDDFGKLALVNDAPRSATICLCEDNCHFLRVDKEDFNRILRDVEANTVRLNEHGQDVLVLEKMPTNVQAQDGSIQSHYKYSVMAGTPEKILEHLLETRMEKNESDDHFLESFLLTHVIFIPTKKLCPALMMHYEAISGSKDESQDIILSHKRRVIQFVQEWQSISGDEFLEDNTISAFLKELQHTLSNDSVAYPELKNDVTVIEHMMQARLSNNTMEPPKYSMKKRLTPNVILARKGSKENVIDESKFRRGSIKAADESIFRVYCADHSYCTLRVPMTTTVSQIINQAQEKLALGEDLVLCEVKSNGERILFRENDLGVINSLTLNGRLFLAPREHLDAVTPLPEQDEILTGTASSLELVGSQELAYHMTVYDWELFTAVPEYELIYQVFGRYKFGKTTANLDLFLRRFNEVQYWVVTEMLLTQNLSKRVHLLRKFIKLASYCREYQNMSSFFAIVLGLSNIAVSRLSQTWEKLPGKLKKMFSEFETIMDPSRNHRVYRLSIAKMRPPIIPFMPLLMKDMTFTHEGNKTYYDGLVNFEKMHMIAQTLRTVRCCRSVPLNLDLPNSSVKPPFDVKAYVRNLVVMDNQRTLAQLSHKLEPRRT